MTVLTTTSDISYDGLAGQASFSYNFRVDEKADMVVSLDSIEISQNDFTMTGLGSALGGTVTLVTPLLAPALVVLSRQLSPTQETDYQPFDPFPAESHEDALDKLTMLIQEGSTASLRSLRFPVGDNANPVIPNVENRNSKYLAFDGAGDVVAIPGTNESPNAVLKPVDPVTFNNLMMFDSFKNSLDSGFSIADLIDLIVPVGTILHFVDSAIDPAVIYPGTVWFKHVLEGRSLISSGPNYPSGSVGGAADAVVVAHTHGAVVTDPGHKHLINAGFNDGATPETALDNATNLVSTRTSQPATTGISVNNDNTGVSGTNQNMPPYLVVNRWERIPSVPPTTPEFDAHWARVTDKTCPTIEADLRTLFASLLSSGLWNVLDDLCVIHCNAADSLLGLKGFQDSVHAGPVPDWNTQRGYRLGTTEDSEEPDPNLRNWIDSGIIDNGSTQFTTNSRSMFYQILSPDFSSGATVTIRGSIGGVLSGEGDSTFIQIFENSDLSQFIDEGALAGATFNASGLYLGSRESATVINFLVEDDFQTAVATSSTGVANAFPMLVGATSDTDGSPLMTEFYTSDMVAWGFGGGMTQAQSELLRDIIKTYTSARGVSDSPEFDAHWARVVDKSDPTLEADLKALFTTLIADGVYDLLDDLCVVHTGMADSLLGLKGFQDSALGNTPTFNSATGFTTTAAPSVGTGSWVDTQIDGNLTTKFQRDDMTAFCYVQSTSGQNFSGATLMGTRDSVSGGVLINYVDAGFTLAAASAGTLVTEQVNGTSNDKFYGVTRFGPAGNQSILAREGVNTTLAALADAGAYTFNPIFVGGYNTNGAIQPIGTIGTQNHTAWGVGGGLTSAQLSNLDTAISTYMVARGI